MSSNESVVLVNAGSPISIVSWTFVPASVSSTFPSASKVRSDEDTTVAGALDRGRWDLMSWSATGVDNRLLFWLGPVETGAEGSSPTAPSNMLVSQ